MIAFDIDNTIALSLEGLRLILAKRLGCRPDELRATDSYRYPLILGGSLHEAGSDETLNAAYEGAWTCDEICRLMPAIEGARELLWELNEDGLLRGYVTRRPEHQRGVTEEWLRRQTFPSAPLVHAPHPAGEARVCKSVGMREIGAHILIDDHPGEVQGVLDANLAAILIDLPHNRTSGPDWQPSGLGIRQADLQSAVTVARGLAALLQSQVKRQSGPMPQDRTTSRHQLEELTLGSPARSDQLKTRRNQGVMGLTSPS